MRIFHYTSIETLALILKNRTIRFSRLDKVDDPEEYDITEDGVTLSHYCFASCWTRNEDESLPQWYMYGSGSHGVRIEMDSDMFEYVDGFKDKSFLGGVEYTKQGDRIMPVILNGKVLEDIIYVDDMSNIEKRIFHAFEEQKAIHFHNIGLYKRKDWNFQKECRFRLYALPLKPRGVGLYYSPSEVIADNVPPKAEYIDIPLSPIAFANMKILLGPKVNAAERIIIQSLMKEYLRKEDFGLSVFTNKM